MRLTLIVQKKNYFGHNKVRIVNNLWKFRGKYRDPSLKVPPAVEKLGVEIIDPVEEMKSVPETWDPPPGDERFMEPKSITENPLYKEKPALCFHHHTNLIYDLPQAAVLTKSQIFRSLPSNVTSLINAVDIPNKERKLQEFIMHANEWNSTRDKLPQRKDPENIRFKFPREYGIPRNKRMTILLRDMVNLCQCTAAKFPGAITDRRLITDHVCHSNYKFKGELILLKSKSNYFLGTNKGLPQFGDPESTKTYQIPDIFPIDPTVDLAQIHIYSEDINPGYKPQYNYNEPHTIFHINSDFWRTDSRMTRSLMFCFCQTVARAKTKYGNDVKQLPEPICVQCVDIDETTMNFTCFQLNTLDFDTEDGVKNMAWLDAGNQLFKKHLPQPWKKEDPYLKTRYTDFNPVGFDKMFAMILNGLQLSSLN